jgi:lysophospholipase L1-like esterase
MMRRHSHLVRYACLGVTLLAAVGCSSHNSSSSSTSASTSQTATNFDFGNNDPKKVVAFGDSITFGTLELKRRGFRLDTSNNYPNILQGQLKRLDPAWQVINRGRGGEHSYEGAARINTVLQSDRPGFILIMEGTNDAHQCQDSVVLINSLRSMVRAAKANKTIPIIGTIPPSFRNNPCADDIIDEANGNIRALAGAENIVLAEIFNGMNHRDLFGLGADRDPLHPNEQGYAVMANIWYQAILQAVPGGAVVALRRRA